MADDESAPPSPSESARPQRAEPPAAAVEDNHWHALPVPDLTAVRPREVVTVVVPVRGDADALARTLAGLEAQEYPRELLDVVVVDDGSDPPLHLPPERLPARLLRQEREGFGAGRARNLGSAHAAGEILVFLDADMVAEPQLVTAHVRWHQQVRDAVVIGPRWHAPLRDLDLDAIAAGAVAGQAAELPAEPEAWWEEFVVRTDDLTARRGDLHAAVMSCNLSLRASYFRSLGGFRPFGRRGIEDTELGWRAFADGALLVPEFEARAWHVDTSHLMSDAAPETKRRRLPLLWHHVPAGSARPRGAARRFLVPRVVVEVDGEGHPFESVVGCVDGILGGELRDVAVAVTVGDDEEGALAREALEPDSRVVFDDDGPPAPVRLRLPQPVEVAPGAIAGVCAPLERGQAGVARVTVPLEPEEGAPEVLAVAWCERARRRAGRVLADRRVEASWERQIETAAELFGQRWMGGSAHGLGAHQGASDTTAGGPQIAAIARAQRAEEQARKQAAEAEALAARVTHLEAQLESLRNRRAMRVADSAARVRRRLRR